MIEVRKQLADSVLSASPRPADNDPFGLILQTPTINGWSDAEALIGAMRALHSTLKLTTLYELVVKVIASLTDTEAAVLLLHRPLTHHMINFKLWSRDHAKTMDLPKDLGDAYISWLNDHHSGRDPFEIPPPEVSAAIRRSVNSLPLKEHWVPLVSPQRVMGVIGVMTSERHPGRRVHSLLVPLVEQATVALNNAVLYRTVERQSLETQTLLDASRMLLTSHDLDEVLLAILDALNRVLPHNAAGVFLVGSEGDVERIVDRGYEYDESQSNCVPLEHKAQRGLVGWVAQHGQPLLIGDVRQDERYQPARPQTNSEMVVPIFAADRLVGVLNLERDSVNGFLEADVGLVTAFARHAGVALERARTEAAAREQKHLRGELEVARHIQQTFLPETSPQVPGFDIAGVNIPSEQVGGDYYDFLPIVGDQLGIAIADVSGKGVPAALIMAAFRASLIAEIRNNFTLRRIMEKVNRLLCERNEQTRFVTAIYGILDARNNVFTFSNAGHNPGILRRADGSIILLGEGGVALGIFPDTEFDVRALSVNPGDVILLYTDGVTDTIGTDGEMFELERLIDVLHKHANLPSESIIDAIRLALVEYADPTAPVDDVTLVCIRVENGTNSGDSSV